MPDRYELIERIAVGGMAEIFRADMIGAAGFAKPVAVKRILPQLASDPEFVDRFVAEAKISVTLAHPNIVSVFELSRFGESLYIAMEFVDGPDLSSLLSAARKRGDKLALGPALHIAGELLRGLEHAHSHGVIHRDVSPSNVLISRAGEVKITDFGIAKAGGFDLTSNRRVMGKWPYMSPEQAGGAEVDHRSDLFSAGAVIYELLCGARLFRGETTNEIIEAIRRQRIGAPSEHRPEVPEAVDRALGSMLDRARERRAPDAGAVLEQLSEVPLQLSRNATALALAAEIERLCRAPAPSGSQTPAKLLDDIINSELAHARGGRRATVQTGGLGRRTERLSFVSTETDGDIGQWLLSDDRGTYTLDQTLQLFALPAGDAKPDPGPSPASTGAVTAPQRPVSEPRPEPQPAPAPRTALRLPLALIAAALIAAGAIGALLWTRDRPASRTAAPAADATPAPSAPDPAVLTVITRPPDARVTLAGQSLGVTPIESVEVPPRRGAVELVIAREGFEPIGMRVDLAAGAVVRISQDLQPE